jgi:hypothetical protein
MAVQKITLTIETIMSESETHHLILTGLRDLFKMQLISKYILDVQQQSNDKLYACAVSPNVSYWLGEDN